MSVSAINVATRVTRMMTRTVGIAMAYFRGRKKSCTGCDVSTNGYIGSKSSASKWVGGARDR